MPENKKQKPRHLGRGLQSLLGPISSPEPENLVIPDFTPAPVDAELTNSLAQLPIDSISSNPYQPRYIWDETQLAEKNGVRSPAEQGLIYLVIDNLDHGLGKDHASDLFRRRGLVGCRSRSRREMFLHGRSRLRRMNLM